MHCKFLKGGGLCKMSSVKNPFDKILLLWKDGKNIKGVTLVYSIYKKNEKKCNLFSKNVLNSRIFSLLYHKMTVLYVYYSYKLNDFLGMKKKNMSELRNFLLVEKN